MTRHPCARTASVGSRRWRLVLGATPLVLGSTALAQSDANRQVLDRWQAQTGEQRVLDERGVAQFQGAVSVDIYEHAVVTDAGNDPRLLSSLQPGLHQRTTVQADWRRTDAGQHTSYVQGVWTGTDDRGLQPRYGGQVTSFQAGWAGPGYRIAFGDVVAGFSNLGSNLGLRGLLGGWEGERTSVSAFAGAVAESWEALARRTPRDGRPARAAAVREAIGLKAEHRFAPAWSAFATLQSWRDRPGETGTGAAAGPAARGRSASVGLRLAAAATQAQFEWARSSRRTDGAVAVDDDAWQLTLSHRAADTLTLRAGAHDLRPGFATLAQTIAPGLREVYLGADWTLAPALLWSIDLRDARSRLVAAGGAVTATDLDTLSNRIGWRIDGWPGWTLQLSDLRTRGRDAAGQPSRNSGTQLALLHAGAVWNGQLMLGGGEARAAGGQTRLVQWQAQLGRTLGSAGGDGSGAWQLSVGQQRQRYSTTDRPLLQSTLGLAANASHRRWGQWQLSAQWQHTGQPTPGAPDLRGHAVGLNWSLTTAAGWSWKAYLRHNRRNHGDARLRVDERTLGVQGSLAW